MNIPPTSELQEIVNFTASFLGEFTPRALVIVGAARIEEEVKAIVAAAAPGFDADHRSHVFRVDLMASLGLFGDDLAFCLKKIAKIRNYFAHTSAVVAITDADVRADVDALYQRLEQAIQLSAVSADFFAKMAAKIPRGFAPATWVDDDWRRYQTTIVIVLYHLVVVRYNVPCKAAPIPLFQYAFK
jgi:hypothetical protein